MKRLGHKRLAYAVTGLGGKTKDDADEEDNPAKRRKTKEGQNTVSGNFATTMKDAAKLKAYYVAEQSRAKQLVSTITAGTRYAWANNAENLGLLKLRLEKMENEIDVFDRDVLLLEPKDLKIKYMAARLEVQMPGFLKKRTLVDKVKAAVDRILSTPELE